MTSYILRLRLISYIVLYIITPFVENTETNVVVLQVCTCACCWRAVP